MVRTILLDVFFNNLNGIMRNINNTTYLSIGGKIKGQRKLLEKIMDDLVSYDLL